MQNDQPIVSIKNFGVEFPSGMGRFTAVNNISFDIFKGEVVAIVGESGSGKSVTGLSIIQLLAKNAGASVEGSIMLNVDDRLIEINSASEREMSTIRGKHVAMIFQDPMSSLNPALRCGDQIAEAMENHLKLSASEAKLKVLSILENVGIDDPEGVYAKYPSQISGGQKQRVLIAMAISCNPDLLIADEPTTALDAAVRKRVLKTIKTMKSQKDLSILFITHDLDLAAEIADRVLVMYAGKIAEQGDMKSVFENPQHPYTKGLISSRPPKKGRYYFLPTIEDFMRLSSDGLSNETVSGKDILFKGIEITKKDREKRHRQIYGRKPILKVSHLSKSFRKNNGLFAPASRHHAVDDVSFELFRGETLGIVGQSGCGKTTLVRSIVGLNSGYNGEVLFEKKDENGYESITSLAKMGKRIQYIFQDPYASLDPRMSIGRTLAEPLEVLEKFTSKQDKLDRIYEILAQVGLKPYHYDRYPHEFSGGQRQRICIARALLLEPEILICDEPVSSLDVSVQAQVLNLLNELKYEYNLSYLFISHDLNVVRFMSDRVLVMNDGKIIEEGEADQLFEHPQEDYTKALFY